MQPVISSAFTTAIPDNGRIIQNIIQGCDLVMSHITHLYHLSALDFINTSSFPGMAPWLPSYTASDMIDGSYGPRLRHSLSTMFRHLKREGRCIPQEHSSAAGSPSRTQWFRAALQPCSLRPIRWTRLRPITISSVLSRLRHNGDQVQIAPERRQDIHQHDLHS